MKTLRFRDFSVSTKLLLGFSLSLLIIIIILINIYLGSVNVTKSVDMIIHIHKVIKNIDDIETKLIDMETGQRGFIITGDYNYLDPYYNSLGVLENNLSFLKNLVSYNPDQVERIETLEELIKEKAAEMNETINLREQKGFEAARKIVMLDKGKILMDEIRAVLSDIESEEVKKMAETTTTPYQTIKKTRIKILILISLGILISLINSLIISVSITEPLKKLKKGILKVGDGILDYKNNISGKDEIAQLSQTFEDVINRLKTTMASKEELEKEIEIRKEIENKLKKTKSNLEKSQALLIKSNNTKDKLFSIIAHDLKSPFTSLLGFSEMLYNDYDELTPEEKRKFINFIYLGIQNAYKLLDNLLIWSRSQRDAIIFNPEEHNLYLLANNIIKMLEPAAKAKSIDIKNKVPRYITVIADKEMLTVIFLNLINNAIKFTHINGRIIIYAEIKTYGEDDQFAEIKIKDNGVGIPGDKIPLLFESGIEKSTEGTANEKGTGLGLSICKEFVEKHGGEIWVNSKPGEGSVFHFTIPMA